MEGSKNKNAFSTCHQYKKWRNGAFWAQTIALKKSIKFICFMTFNNKQKNVLIFEVQFFLSSKYPITPLHFLYYYGP